MVTRGSGWQRARVKSAGPSGVASPRPHRNAMRCGRGMAGPECQVGAAGAGTPCFEDDCHDGGDCAFRAVLIERSTFRDLMMKPALFGLFLLAGACLCEADDFEITGRLWAAALEAGEPWATGETAYGEEVISAVRCAGVYEAPFGRVLIGEFHTTRTLKDKAQAWGSGNWNSLISHSSAAALRLRTEGRSIERRHFGWMAASFSLVGSWYWILRGCRRSGRFGLVNIRMWCRVGSGHRAGSICRFARVAAYWIRVFKGLESGRFWHCRFGPVEN